MLAASISTYAGYFLGWSSIIAQDIVAPLLSSRGARVALDSVRGSRGRQGSTLAADPEVLLG